MNSSDFFRLRRYSKSSFCKRRISAKLWRNTLRATEFQPESIIKMRKRGAAGGLYSRRRLGLGGRAGKSMTTPAGAEYVGWGGEDPFVAIVSTVVVSLWESADGTRGSRPDSSSLDMPDLSLGGRVDPDREPVFAITASPSPE